MSLAVVEKAIKDIPVYEPTKFEDTTSPQIKGIFKKIRQYLKSGQEIVFYLEDACVSYGVKSKHVLTKEKVTIYTPDIYIPKCSSGPEKKTSRLIKETYSWEKYLKLLPLFPLEVKIAVEEMKKLKESNPLLWQLIK